MVSATILIQFVPYRKISFPYKKVRTPIKKVPPPLSKKREILNVSPPKGMIYLCIQCLKNNI